MPYWDADVGSSYNPQGSQAVYRVQNNGSHGAIQPRDNGSAWLEAFSGFGQALIAGMGGRNDTQPQYVQVSTGGGGSSLLENPLVVIGGAALLAYGIYQVAK